MFPYTQSRYYVIKNKLLSFESFDIRCCKILINSSQEKYILNTQFKISVSFKINITWYSFTF
jgi:hypothetical protein